jgi:hypothetical protein
VRLEHATRLDAFFDVERSVGVGVDGDAAAQALARQRDQRLATSWGGILVIAHAAPDLQLHGARAGGREQFLEARDLVFRAGAAIGAGQVHRYGVAQALAEQIGDGFAAAPAEQVEHRQFGERDARPKGDANELVVGLVDVHAVDQGFELPGIPAGEKKPPHVRGTSGPGCVRAGWESRTRRCRQWLWRARRRARPRAAARWT